MGRSVLAFIRSGTQSALVEHHLPGPVLRLPDGTAQRLHRRPRMAMGAIGHERRARREKLDPERGCSDADGGLGAQRSDDLRLRECAARAAKLDELFRQELADPLGLANAHPEQRSLQLTKAAG